MGCGAGTSAKTAQADQAFLTEVHGNAPDISTYRSDNQVLELGNAVCDDLSSGVSTQQVADRIETVDAGNPLPTEDLGVVMTAAGDSLCPKYAGMFGSAGPG
jgi:uncharacterized protein DUF732